MSRTTALATETVIAALLLHGCAGTSATTGTHDAHSPTEEKTAAAPTSDSSAEMRARANRPAEENCIYFATGSIEIDETGRKKLLEHASRLQQNPKMIVTLTGLTDDSGSRSYNLLIAEKCVRAVAELLFANGVARSQVRTYTLGNKTPDVPCKSEACRQKMRRVEMRRVELEYPEKIDAWQ